MTGKTVTRANLSEAVYNEIGLSRNESTQIVESVITEISDALVRGEAVKLSSFGSFMVRHKNGRVGRNRKPEKKCRLIPAACLPFVQPCAEVENQ